MSENQKKLLANQIKEDLWKDLVEVQKEEKDKNGFERCSWSISLGENCTDCRGNEWRLTYFGSDKDKWKDRIGTWEEGWIEFFPEELEPNDWKEIESLIQQIKKKEEKETQKYQEEQAKIDQKLNRNPKLFLYEGVWEWAVDYDPRGYDKFHVFRGVKNGQEFHLTFRENQVENFSYNHNEKIFFQIEGVENIPFQPEGKNNKGLPWKAANLNDKITITEFKENPEKEQPIKNNPTDKLSNSQSKELNNKTLLQYFQRENVKSIKLEGEILIIERNDNWTSAKPLIGFPELKGIDEYLQRKNDKTVSRQELELSNNSDTAPTTKPHDNNNTLWISCGIGGTLIITVIIGLLLKRKNRIKKH